MSVWSRTMRVGAKDVNLHRRLRTSRLLELLHKASASHVEELGWGRDKTFDCGFSWAVVMERLEITRMPEYGEAVRIVSWPGETMRVMFPRHFRMEDSRGDAIVRACALTTLVDSSTHLMVGPEVHGVVIDGVLTGDEIAAPRIIQSEKCEKTVTLAVPFSRCDLNGRMSTTCYPDVVEDHLIGVAEGWELSSISLEYASDLRFGDPLVLRWRENARSAYIEGFKGEERSFRMRIDYR